MAGVFIDIPGIGKIEATGAASEATLKAILKAMGGGGGAGGGGGGASGRSGGLASKAANAAANNFGKSAGYASSMAKQAGNMLQNVSGTVGFFGKATIGATKGINSAAIAGANLASELANVGDSLTAAARSLNAIPVVGGLLSSVLGAVAGAAESVAKSMKDATGSGASFGGSMSELSRSAGQAGQTMEQFGAFVKNNGVAMGAFGSTTEDGAKNFASLSGRLRAASSDLYALGYGTAEINQGLANYGKLLRMQGHQGTKSNAELIDGSKKYLKEMDQLAKITGEERSAKEKEREALVADAQFRAAMAGLGPDVEESALKLIQSMPNKAMQDFAKDMIANGTATTAANRLVMSQYPGLASQLTAMHQTTQKNVKIQDSEIKSAIIRGKSESQNLRNIKQAVAANTEEFGVLAESTAGFNKVNVDAIDAAEGQQAAAAKNTDGQLKAVEQFKSSLAALTNNIMMQLASSGGLGLLMAVFEKLAAFVVSVVIPGIGILIPILGKIYNGVVMLLQPVIESVTKAFGGMKGTLGAVDNILNWVFDTLNGVVRGGILIFESLLKAFDTLSGPFTRLSAAIFGTEQGATTFSDTLIRIGSAVGSALEILAQVIGFVVDYAVIPLVKMFTDYFLPTIKAVANAIQDYLVPILVAAGVAFLAFNAITIAATIAKFALTAAMVIVTGGFALLSAGVAIVAGAFALLTSPIGLVIVAIGALLIYFKKMGGDMQVLGDGFKWLWSYVEELGQNLVKFYYYLMDKVTVGDEYKQKMAEQDKVIEATLKNREALETKMATRMADNRAAKEKEAAEEGKDQRAEAHIAAKKSQLSLFSSQIPNSLAGSVAPAVGDAVKSELAKPERQLDYNQGPEALLKQFAGREGSPLAGAENQKAAIVAASEQKKAAEEKAAKEAETARAAAAANDPRRLDNQSPPKTQESAETLLANLNTKMEQLLKYAHNTTDNTYATVVAARGLTKDLFKSM